jgi:tyrosine-protein kinase Etk/Wzc
MGEIEESVKRFNQAGTTVTGIIFNGLKPRIGRYGYGSKYGKYRYAQYKY